MNSGAHRGETDCIFTLILSLSLSLSCLQNQNRRRRFAAAAASKQESDRIAHVGKDGKCFRGSGNLSRRRTAQRHTDDKGNALLLQSPISGVAQLWNQDKRHSKSVHKNVHVRRYISRSIIVIGRSTLPRCEGVRKRWKGSRRSSTMDKYSAT